jgi:hypothetical protein
MQPRRLEAYLFVPRRFRFVVGRGVEHLSHQVFALTQLPIAVFVSKLADSQGPKSLNTHVVETDADRTTQNTCREC